METSQMLGPSFFLPERHYLPVIVENMKIESDKEQKATNRTKKNRMSRNRNMEQSRNTQVNREYKIKHKVNQSSVHNSVI